MDINDYAPVSIPTLNRYTHFKRCLESLEKCTGADKTEVYVGLDYPPSDKYRKGWEDIDSYLKHKEGHHRFKKLIVYRRDHNYGIKGPLTNAKAIQLEIRKKYDRYILTEDDNEFSPNFLEFMNWGLKTFKDDPSIIAICGFNDISVDFLDDNVFKHIWYNAWGVGRWFHKWDALKQKVMNDDYSKLYLKDCSLSLVFKRDVWVASSMIHSLKTGIYHGDGLVYRQKDPVLYSIFPKLSMVRNWGTDGSGQHGSNSNLYRSQVAAQIDSSRTFCASTTTPVYNKDLENAYNKKHPFVFKIRLYRITDFLMYKLTGKSVENVARFYRSHIRKYLKK